MTCLGVGNIQNVGSRLPSLTLTDVLCQQSQNNFSSWAKDDCLQIWNAKKLALPSGFIHKYWLPLGRIGSVLSKTCNVCINLVQKENDDAEHLLSVCLLMYWLKLSCVSVAQPTIALTAETNCLYDVSFPLPISNNISIELYLYSPQSPLQSQRAQQAKYQCHSQCFVH